MSNQNFIDYVKINGKSGRGGPGSHSYFRDNLNAKGGPDGGDGCDGDDDGKITWGEAKACGAPKSFKPAFLHVAGKDKAVDHGEFMAACKAHGGEAQEEVEVEEEIKQPNNFNI